MPPADSEGLLVPLKCVLGKSLCRTGQELQVEVKRLRDVRDDKKESDLSFSEILRIQVFEPHSYTKEQEQERPVLVGLENGSKSWKLMCSSTRKTVPVPCVPPADLQLLNVISVLVAASAWEL